MRAAAKGRVLTLPNALTVSRIVCAPFLAQAIVAHETNTALCILAYAAVTDVADGWIARRFDMGSDLGSYLDPLADKLLITAGSVALGVAGLLPVPLVALFLVRDATLAQGTAWHLYRTVKSARLPVQLEASSLSKANTALQTAVFFTALLSLEGLTAFLVPVVAGTTWFSGFQYYFTNPLKNLESREGISRFQERAAQGVNTVGVLAGLGLFVWCLVLTKDEMAKREGHSKT
jgi:cardiolipin synthase